MYHLKIAYIAINYLFLYSLEQDNNFISGMEKVIKICKKQLSNMMIKQLERERKTFLTGVSIRSHISGYYRTFSFKKFSILRKNIVL